MTQDFTDAQMDDISEADLALTRVDSSETDCPRDEMPRPQRRFPDICRDDNEDPRRPAG